MTDTSTGLNCPRCGGIVPIPEGQVIVRCPYCELRSVVRGERGLRRYQLTCRIDRGQAVGAFRKFLSASLAIARDAPGKAQLTDAFIAYLPFWMAWGRAMGYALGQERVGSGDHKRYEPREVRIVEEMTWNGAACDVGEFGVEQVPLTSSQALEPFQADNLHNSGLVFEPVGSAEEARQIAHTEFENRIRRKGNLDRLSQLFVRVTRQRMGLVYYPMWILRYLYRGRSFQVVVDGTSGRILYGKAPGNTLYRAAVLVGGMLVGAILAVDVPSLMISLMGNSRGDSSEGLLAVAGGAFLAGLALMYGSFRKFRYGEQYEYRSGPQKGAFDSLRNLTGQMGSPDDLVRQLVERSSQWPRQ